MNIPTEVLIVAVEAMRAAEKANDSVQGFLYGNRCVLRDVSKMPGADELWSRAFDPDDYQTTHDAMMLEMEAIKDARRIVAAAQILTKYERDRVWGEAVEAVRATYVPPASSVTDSALAAMKESSKVDCVISGAQRSKDEAVTTVIRAMRRDKAQHGETGDIPLDGV